MFGLMTKAAHEEAVAAAKMDAAVHYEGKVAALESQIGDLTRALARADQDVNALKVQLSDQRAIVAALKPDAEKWRAKIAKDKAYEATKRVRKPRAKNGA